MLKKVLVVDDSVLIHQMFKMMLMRYTCDIVDALNGRDGLDKLAANPDVNLILLDINMPHMNGLEFMEKVKDLRKYDHVPIILVNTEDKDEDAKRGLALGARGCVKKPLRPSTLHALIEKLHAATT